MPDILIVLMVVALGGALVWWLLITTEGVYLGRRVVIGLYDLYARRYDRIKKFDAGWETITLAKPISDALQTVERPLILDVATGTGRLPQTLIDYPDFDGYLVGLDFSRRMLTVAAENLRGLRGANRIALIHQDAQRLPFPDATFDMVACLEALEFMPRPEGVLAELVRVARPGALILLTNRRGALMPGKTQRGSTLADRLRRRYGLIDVSVSLWQVDYEQVWAFKPGDLDPALEDGAPFDPARLLRCPACGQAQMQAEAEMLRCAACGTAIRVSEGRVPIIEYAAREAR